MNDAAKTGATVATTAVIAAVLGAKLGAPSAPAPPPVTHPPHVHKARSDQPDRELALRLVSCGDSREAAAVGDDLAGEVQPGTGATACTIIFAIPWGAPAHCLVTSGAGHVAGMTPTDLIVEGVDGAFSYACEELGR